MFGSCLRCEVRNTNIQFENPDVANSLFRILQQAGYWGMLPWSFAGIIWGTLLTICFGSCVVTSPMAQVAVVA